MALVKTRVEVLPAELLELRFWWHVSIAENAKTRKVCETAVSEGCYSQQVKGSGLL
jgi:hypothetical protein